MMRIFEGRIVGRCVVCLTLLAVAVWSATAMVDGRQNVLAEQIAQDEYMARLQANYSQHSQLQVGSVGELFTRMR